MGCYFSRQNSALNTLKTRLNILNYQIHIRFFRIEQETHLQTFLETEMQLFETLEIIAQNQIYCQHIRKYFGELEGQYNNSNQFEKDVNCFSINLTLLTFQYFLETKNLRTSILPLTISQLKQYLGDRRNLEEIQNFKKFNPIIYGNSIIGNFLTNPLIQNLKMLIEYFEELDDNHFFIIFRHYLNIPYQKNDLYLRKICKVDQRDQLENIFNSFVTSKLFILEGIKKIMDQTAQQQNHDLILNYFKEFTNDMKSTQSNINQIQFFIDRFEKQLRLIVFPDYLSNYLDLETLKFDNIEKMDLQTISKIQTLFFDKKNSLDEIKKNLSYGATELIRTSINDLNKSLRKYTKEKLSSEKLKELLAKVRDEIDQAEQVSRNTTNPPEYREKKNQSQTNQIQIQESQRNK